jgi:signal transduction histidine kinase
MATILIIEDRVIDRKLLATVLRSGGYETLEAADGGEALHALKRRTPDLVISDILMPSVDGYEFVLRMRELPRIKTIPVIFYTATYHEREARALAHQCGVFNILVKPSPRPVILAAVDAALSTHTPPATALLDRATFDRDHLRLVRSTLAANIDRFEADRQRMAAVADAAHQIASERDPQAVLRRACAEARQITLAQHVVTGLLNDTGSAPQAVIALGFDETMTAALQPATVAGTVIGAVVSERRAVRTRNPGGRPEALGLPPAHPRVSSMLNVPIASATRVYGWMSLQNKLGTDEFTETDESVAITLATHAGIAYENARHLDDLHRRVTASENELRHTAAVTRSVREEERSRLSRTLHDELGQSLVGLKMDLRRLAAELAPVSDPLKTTLTGQIDVMLQRTDETLATIRRISGELRPDVLDKLGLVAAIEWQALEFERRSAIRCRVQSLVEQVQLDPGRSTSVFRIVQEALSNVLQHARATRVTISVRESTRAVTVTITDNGRGISASDIASRDSLGLIGMRERAELLGGTLTVRVRRPSGTIVKVTIPLADRRRATRLAS